MSAEIEVVLPMKFIPRHTEDVKERQRSFVIRFCDKKIDEQLYILFAKALNRNGNNKLSNNSFEKVMALTL